MDYFPQEKAIPIRNPSTALLCIDSADRNTSLYPLANDFKIQRTNTIANGFFTRVAVSEMVLDWNTPNVSSGIGNLTFSITISGTTYIAIINFGFYTAYQALQAILTALNASGTGVTWSLANPIPGAVYLYASTSTTFTVVNSLLARQLGIPVGVPITVGTTASAGLLINSIDLRPCRYLDVVSPTLTYTQKVRDVSTSSLVRDMVTRWYFSWDNVPASLDAYGFPILMGYTAFTSRRAFPFPKQINWASNLPIGNMEFQLYNQDGVIMPIAYTAGANNNTNFLLTLLLSEV